MLLLFLVSTGAMAYVLAGYPLLLKLIVAFRGPRPIRRADVTPRLSFVISAYNEAAVIREKLENALSLDYPRDLLQIVVISDCSSDGTDEIVKSFERHGVTLARMAQRRGKTAGLNATVPTLTGEIVVFSDANAMYEAGALRMLARNFADAEVGYVTGEARYLKNGQAPADVGERAYWGYEMQMKRLETQLGSMVGGDGAIYAIRRALWRTLPEDAINDFLNPLQIVAAGWRGVYEPDAVCWEETGGGVRSEYKRRVRIVSRSWRAVFQARGVLNPLRVGLFAWSVWSHKVLRWASGFFAVGAGASFLVLYARWAAASPIVTLSVTAATVVGVVATTVGRRTFGMAAYFGVINAASLVGLYKGSIGSVSGVWAPPRAVEPSTDVAALVPVGRVFLVAIGTVATAALVGVVRGHAGSVAGVFWGSIGALAYVYVLYPAIVGVMRYVARRPVKGAAFEPSVCLFIAANDEAAVIASKVENALALDYPLEKLDIVVASDGSVDGTNDIVRPFGPRVRLLEFSPRQGKMATIIRGVDTVSADVIVFSDANTFLEPDAVRSLVRNFADPQVGCVSGDVVLIGERALLGQSEDLYYRYERWIQRAESEIGSMIGADGALYAIRRRLFEAPWPDTILDDMAIPMSVVRRGYRAVFESDALAHEQGVTTAQEEFWRKSRVVAGAIQFLTRRDSSVPWAAPQVILALVSHKALRWLSPAFAASAFMSSVVMAVNSPPFSAVALTEVGVVLLGLAGCIPAARKLPLIGLAHYFCLVLAAAAIGFLRGLTGRQSVIWRRFVRSTPLGETPA
jgi:cellulose synthase/poly-beta-1,6-N-acetylglucosamine synthase-like glycosyltransferase